MINEGENYRTDNIFNLIQELEGLCIKDSDKCKSASILSSPNEENFFRSSSVDYFRGSNISNNLSLENQTILIDQKKNLISKNIYNPEDFKTICTIGSGAYSKVVKARHIKTKEIYAIKIIDKHFMEKEKKYYQIHLENELLNMCDCPNIIKVYGAYEDDFYIYLVLEYCGKGDLGNFISKNGRCSIK